MKRGILFIVPYPVDEAPSQRFRFEQYFSILEAHGYRYRVHSFWTLNGWYALYKDRNSIKKLWYLIVGMVRRLAVLTSVMRFEYVFIHREASSIGPPIFELVVAKLFNRKVIYDFDDAIWKTDKYNEPIVERLLRWRSKVNIICALSYKVSCGNDYLADYAAQFTNRVVINPTTLETERLFNKDKYLIQKDVDRIVIGWTGSHSTLKYLNALEGVLQHIQRVYSMVDILVIADKPPTLQLPRITFNAWSKATEVSDLLCADIGIMPLPDDEWSKGKCGFKALQYMALQIPAVISPVGVNTKIVSHGVNGFLCMTDDEWIKTLSMLIENSSLRKQIGIAGRKTVVASYSVRSNAQNFLSLFQ